MKLYDFEATVFVYKHVKIIFLSAFAIACYEK